MNIIFKIGSIIFFSTMGILFTLNTIDMIALMNEYKRVSDICRNISNPETSVENERLYEHCNDYPETYGINKTYVFYSPWFWLGHIVFDDEQEPYIHRVSNLTPPLNSTWYCKHLAEEFGDNNAFNFTMINNNECEYWSE